MKRPEERIHRQVADYLRWSKPRAVWFHCPNGGGRSKAEAGILKALGTLPGVPDLLFICDGGTIKFIELKAEGKYLSPAQKAFRETVSGMGASYAVCRSVEDVAETLWEWGLAPHRAALRPVHAVTGGKAA